MIIKPVFIAFSNRFTAFQTGLVGRKSVWWVENRFKEKIQQKHDEYGEVYDCGINIYCDVILQCTVPLSISRSSASDFCATSGDSRISRSASMHVSGHRGAVCSSNLAWTFRLGMQSDTDLRLLDDILAFNIVFSSALPLM